MCLGISTLFCRKANLNEDLRGLDAEKVSMVVLEQTTLVVRSLCQCMLSESLLATSSTNWSAVQIRYHNTNEIHLLKFEQFNNAYVFVNLPS